MTASLNLLPVELAQLEPQRGSDTAHITIPGEPNWCEVETCSADRHRDGTLRGNESCDLGRVAPVRWSELAKPCPTCGGTGVEHPWRSVGCGGPCQHPCPNGCVAGRLLVTLTTDCPTCGGKPNVHPNAICGECANWVTGDPSSGVVPVARCVIDVLPVYPWSLQQRPFTHPFVEVDYYAQVWYRNDRWRPNTHPPSAEWVHAGIDGNEWTPTRTLANPPRPGVDWVARLTSVEWL